MLHSSNVAQICLTILCMLILRVKTDNLGKTEAIVQHAGVGVDIPVERNLFRLRSFQRNKFRSTN